MSKTIGTHWAVEANDEIEYLAGDTAITPQGAERCWRERTQLHFLPVQVRRTTPEEDSILTILMGWQACEIGPVAGMGASAGSLNHYDSLQPSS